MAAYPRPAPDTASTPSLAYLARRRSTVSAGHRRIAALARAARTSAPTIVRRLLGLASLGAAAGVVALEIWAVVYILGGFGPLGWLVGAIVLSLWVMFAVPFLMIGVHLLGGDRWRRGLILSPTVPQPSKRDAAAASPPDVHRSNRPAPP